MLDERYPRIYKNTNVAKNSPLKRLKMAAPRRYNDGKETHFAKKHRELMQGVYMTDFDALQVTENTTYTQFDYHNNLPVMKRIVEVKYKMTRQLQAIVEGSPEVKVPAAITATAIMTKELNAGRKRTNTKEMDYWILFQDEGAYPYDIYKCEYSTNTGRVEFEKHTTVWNDEQYVYTFNLD